MMSGQSVGFARSIPVRHSVDVFVAGGGPSGIAAAVTAARAGKSVFLAEGHTCFGGMGTAGLIPAFMQFGDGVSFLAGGIGREIHDRLRAEGGIGPDDGPSNAYGCVSIKAESLKRLYDDMMTESGAAFSLGAQLIAVEMASPSRISHVVCAAKSGLYAVEARVFIDCTGDGDLAAWAGAPFEKGDVSGAMMPGTLCSLWSGIDWDDVHRDGRWAQAVIQEKIDEGATTIRDRHLPGVWRVGADTGGANVGHAFGVDGTDERSLTEAMIAGRKLVLEYLRFYQENMGGYRRAELAATASLMGIRETRRITGDYVLCLDDFRARAVFADEIGRYAYPVDIHASRPDDADYAKFEEEFRAFRYGPGESYGVPYRTLTPRGLDNLLVAGRCISSDRYIQGSVRVMPGCYITGQAAGMAASMAANLPSPDTRAISVADLQRRLLEAGAYLPNCTQ